MRSLKTLRETPPEGFRYVHPETGHKTEATDPITWLDKAKEHRRANGLPIPDDLFEQMMEQLCSTLPPELCEYATGDSQYVDTRLTWTDVLGTITIYLEWKKQGKPFVTQEEAERRASICAGCHLNVRVPGCGGLCQTIAGMVTETKGKLSTAKDAQLLNCAVCKCVNSAQVWFPLDLLEISDTEHRQQQYVTQCWKKKTSQNYYPQASDPPKVG